MHAGMTHEALAERAGVSVRAISSLESGARRAPYRETVRLLAGALGLGPADRDALIAAAIRPRAPARGVPHGVDEPPAPSPPAGLPAPLTSFVGRADEVAALARIVRDPSVRLITLTGAGGCGKSRLGLEVARAACPAFAGGARLVELASVADAALVPQALAAAFAVREAPGVPLLATLQEALAPRRLLLILDNCEHLIDTCADLAARLLAACPGLCILATSREPLRVPGERQWWVPPLPLPEAAAPATPEALAGVAAVDLFMERARARRPDFALTARNAPAVARVCRRLDGLPLAIELAATRVTMMSVEEIAARLDDRFRLLGVGSRTALPRQQTLRATIDWSHDLLSAEERRVFSRLSVFAGSFTLDAAEAVCGGREEGRGKRAEGGPGAGSGERGSGRDEQEEAPAHSGESRPPTRPSSLFTLPSVLDLIGRLVEKSLVMMEEQQGEVRYRLLETLRAYGAERLHATEEAAEIHRRHLDWYAALAVRAELGMAGPDQDSWLARLDLENDNLHAAMEWSRAAGELEEGLHLASALWRFWAVRGYLSTGRRRLRQLLEAADARPGSVTARVRAPALNAAGILARHQGDYREAAALWEAGLALWREIGDRQGEAAALNNLGSAASDHGDAERATALYEESLALWREADDAWGIATALTNLALAAHAGGDDARATTLLEESLDLRRRLGDKERIAESLNILGRVTRSTGDVARAEALHAESLRLRWEVRDLMRMPYCLEGLAAVASLRGQLPRAARLFGAAEALRAVTGSPLPPAQRADYEQRVAAVRAGLDTATCAAAWSEGAAMSPEQAMAYALGPFEDAVLPPGSAPGDAPGSRA
jgi:non-specific serine/threonine protein kinase